MSVSAVASAMTTVFDGTDCAPIALRTIWSTVEIFTNAVTPMKRKGKSDTSASATTSAIGLPRKSSAWCCILLFHRSGGDLAELGEACLGGADDDHLVDDLHQV